MSLPPSSSSSSSYVTAQTEWPTAVSVKPEVRRLLAHFYHLLDIPDPRIGHRFAEEVFTPDGVMFGMGPGFQGHAEIRKARENAWTDYVARRHEMLRVYAHDGLGLDLLVIGRVEMGLRNGKIVREEFVARFVVAVDDERTLGKGNGSGGGPRLKYSRVWSNMEPIMAALREE
ncbi:hypothetical protein LTR99_010359 [Exophiala xenobiotica]|uniref:SnoaL-like domain-containing protein n=1 Tax=Vermiconidia calcicola TaxID=1690605 RepID=A0AAV9Q580_9PEZI|nr:hypothetical protein LTR92_007058 [Exophiala xenobiotica]KAK5534078.1 hypothetical protein LTR25_007058 [Vermiconidia calcicola]KAK5538119.1 hypothetical protein LTR23_007256 [Chaetothyriales sp. CCFEE 6169]KAK5226527.1 hypothetical protein LTR47_008984 [Exophiala xenobiotica]KAK5251474.1 hypothetical protein LTS06_003831 [Exophiala xenobiotica]